MPHPQASPIRLSDKQLSLLEQIARCSTNPYQLVRRTQLILAAAKGVNNTELARAVAMESQQCAPVAGTMASLGTLPKYG